MRSEPHVKRWLDLSWALPAAGENASPVSALGCSPLRDQCIYRGSAAGLQPGDRRTRTHPCPVPGPEACGDAQPRREPESALVLGHRDGQHHGTQCVGHSNRLLSPGERPPSRTGCGASIWAVGRGSEDAGRFASTGVEGPVEAVTWRRLSVGQAALHSPYRVLAGDNTSP
jgi:hypothetical protein